MKKEHRYIDVRDIDGYGYSYQQCQKCGVMRSKPRVLDLGIYENNLLFKTPDIYFTINNGNPTHKESNCKYSDEEFDIKDILE